MKLFALFAVLLLIATIILVCLWRGMRDYVSPKGQAVVYLILIISAVLEWRACMVFYHLGA